MDTTILLGGTIIKFQIHLEKPKKKIKIRSFV